MNLRHVLLASVLLATALAGCADEPPEEEVVIPGSISEEQVQELEERALEQFPRVVEFPNMEALEPVTGIFEGTLGQFAGAGVEWPDDDGNVKAGGETLTFDMSEFVPENQPVEMRLKLKWWGDPGASVDLDIFVDVPGEQDSYDGTSDDESFNWNIVTKFRVVNTVHKAGENLLVGMELQNGKIVHPDGVRYELHYELHFPGNVLAPGIPYVVNVPEGATSLILESEPLVGDEHITSDLVIFAPDDTLVQYVHHNDIATETLRVAVSRPGDYVLYAQHYHGGFLRIETDVQNPNWQARALEPIVVEEVAVSGAAPAPSGRPASGSIDIGGPILDIDGWIRNSGPAGGGADAEFAVVNSDGDYHVLALSGQVDAGQLRAGTPTTSVKNVDRFAESGWGWEWRANAEGLEAGYTAVTYQR